MDDEAAAPYPLPARSLPTQAKRLRRRVASDCLVNVGDLRCSVPAARAGAWIDVEVTADSVAVFAGTECLASHKPAYGPGTCIGDGAHVASLYRVQSSAPAAQAPKRRVMSLVVHESGTERLIKVRLTHVVRSLGRLLEDVGCKEL